MIGNGEDGAQGAGIGAGGEERGGMDQMPPSALAHEFVKMLSRDMDLPFEERMNKIMELLVWASGLERAYILINWRYPDFEEVFGYPLLPPTAYREMGVLATGLTGSDGPWGGRPLDEVKSIIFEGKSGTVTDKLLKKELLAAISLPFAAIPLKVEGTIWAVLLVSGEPDLFKAGTIVRTIEDVFEEIRPLQEVFERRYHTKEFTVLEEMNRTLAGVTERAMVLEKVVGLLNGLDMDRCIIETLEPIENRKVLKIRVKAVIDKVGTLMPEKDVIELTASEEAADTFLKGEPVPISDVSKSVLLSRDFTSHLTDMGIRSAVFLPLHGSVGVNGFIVFQYRRPRSLTRTELEIFRSMTQFVSTAFCKADSMESLRNLDMEIGRRVKEEINIITKRTERLEAILEQGPMATIALDAGMNIGLWNKKAEELTGYHAKEMVGTTYSHFSKNVCGGQCPQDPFLSGTCDRALETDTEVRTKTGGRVAVRMIFSLMCDPDGEVEGVTISFFKISRSSIGPGHRGQLGRSGPGYSMQGGALGIGSAASGSNGVAILVADKFYYINSRFAQAMGYTNMDLLDKSIIDILPPGELPVAWKKLFMDDDGPGPGKEGAERSMELVFTRKDRTFMTASVSVKPIDYGGKPAKFLLLKDYHHIEPGSDAGQGSGTHHRPGQKGRADGGLRAPITIFLDKDGNMGSITGDMEATCGYRNGELGGLNISMLLRPEKREEFHRFLDELPKGGVPTLGTVFWARDGRMVEVSVNASIPDEEAGTVRLTITEPEDMHAINDPVTVPASPGVEMERMDTLNDILTEVSTCIDFEAIMERGCRGIMSLLGADSASVGVLDEVTNKVRFPTNVNLPPHLNLVDGTIEDGFAVEVMRNQEPIVVNDYADHPKGQGPWKEAGVKNALIVPLIIEGRSVGAIGVFSHDTRKTFDLDDLNQISPVTRSLAAAIVKNNLKVRAENNLHEIWRLKENLDVTLQSMTDGVIVLGLDNNILLINPAAERIFGISAKDIIGRKSADAFTIDFISSFTKAIVETGKKTSEDDINLIDSTTNRNIVVHVKCVPITEAVSDEVRGFLVIAQDVTLVRYMNETTRRLGDLTNEISHGMDAGELLQFIVDRAAALTNSDHGYLFMMDDNGTNVSDFAVCNGSRAEVAAELESTGCGPLQGLISPGSRITAANLTSRLDLRDRSVLFRDVDSILTMPVHYEDRTIGQMVLTRAVRKPAFGEQEENILSLAIPIVSVAIVNAYSAQKVRNERGRFYDMITHAGMGVIVMDLNGECMMMNPAAEDIVVYKKDELLHQSILGIIHEKDLETVFPLIEGLIEGKPFTNKEFRMKTKQNELRYVNASATLMDSDDGGQWIILTFYNITETKKLEMEREQHMKAVEEATRMKSEFLANMSHELRTPLNAILGFTEVLQDKLFGELNEKQLKYLMDIYESGRHLLNLINDVLDLSKIEAGRMEMKMGRFNLANAVRSVHKTAQVLIEKKGHEVVLDIDETMPEIISDESRVRQIMLNLLSNAIKYTPDHGHITISARHDATNFLISIKDNGLGISEKDRARLFEKFWQADTSSTREIGGTGLGLSITMNLLKLLGGEIKVESELGAGSTFTITLPKQSDKGKEAASTKEARLKVMVIEDDEKFADLLSIFLNELGYAPVLVEDSSDVVPIVLKEKPDLITLDVLMNKKDGWMVLSELKLDPDTRNIPVVIISCVEDLRLAKSLGASDYLVKPVSKTLLGKTLAAVLKRRTKVLIIDDDKVDRELLSSYIGNEGFTVLTASSGDEGLRKIEADEPGIVVLDLMMPDIDGFEVIQHLKKGGVIGTNGASGSLPIIVVTAKDLSAEEEKGLKDMGIPVLKKARFTRNDLIGMADGLLKMKNYIGTISDEDKGTQGVKHG